MTEQPKPAPKKRPDYLALVPVERPGQAPKLVRVGVGFTYKNGSIGVLYDATPLAGQIVLVGIDDALPEAVATRPPVAGATYEVNMVRETGNDTFWAEVGSAYRQNGYVSVFSAVWPRDGKLVLTQPREPK